MNVIIVRGPAGSGKSTYIHKRLGDQPYLLCSADLFWLKLNPETGLQEYHFDKERLGEAHASCLSTFLNGLRDQRPLIVVDNTFIRTWEYINYVTAAKLAGYGVEIVDMIVETCEEARACAARNVHKVPPVTVYVMCCEFQPALGATQVKAFA